MYDRILFPTDGSEPAAETLDYALEIAAEHDATIHVLNVADTSRDSLTLIQGDVVDVLETEGEEIVAEAKRRASERGIEAVATVRQGDPATTIVEYGERSAVDLIVMPTHGRSGLTRLLLGSVTERVITTAEVPVLAVNPEEDRTPTYPPGDLLVPTDGSRGADAALAEGIAVARATGATLHVLHVVETRSLGPDARSALKEDELRGQADDIVSAAVETAEAAGVDAIETTVEHGAPAEKIRAYVAEHAIDLAALGTQGTTDFSRYVLGGVSSKIVRTSPVPVIWVRDAEDEE